MDTSGFVIGVDGGGSKTLGEVADLHGTTVATAAVGPTNPNVVGVEESVRTLCDLIRHLCDLASCRPGDLQGIALGLAGGGGEKIQEEIREKVTRGLHEAGKLDPPVQVVTDVRIALEGAFGGRAGIGVVAGTGSSIMYKTEQGDVGLIGGWGRILGDEGSGYFIGLEALRAVMRDYDGASHAKALCEALSSRFGLDSRYRIIEAVYRQQFSIPSLAPIILEFASKSDEVSCGILKRAAALLADQVETALSHMGDSSVRVVLTGGLVEHDTSYKPILVSELVHRFPRIRIQAPQFSPVQGAVMMALSQSREERGA